VTILAYAFAGAGVLLLLVAVTIPLALHLLRHWDVFLPENALPVLLISGTVFTLLSLALLAVVFNNLGLADSRYALGLPEGSIRAVIALLLILLFFISAVFLYSNGRVQKVNTLDPVSQATIDGIPATDIVGVRPSEIDKTKFRVERRADTAVSDDLAQQLLTTISTLVVAVAAFYFGANSVQAARGAVGGAMGGELATRVRDSFEGDAFSGVKASVAGRTAVLTGTVLDDALKEEAQRAALAVPGIETVVNRLTVEAAEAPPEEGPEAGPEAPPAGPEAGPAGPEAGPEAPPAGPEAGPEAPPGEGPEAGPGGEPNA
jgi:hypothetical protein